MAFTFLDMAIGRMGTSFGNDVVSEIGKWLKKNPMVDGVGWAAFGAPLTFEGPWGDELEVAAVVGYRQNPPFHIDLHWKSDGRRDGVTLFKASKDKLAKMTAGEVAKYAISALERTLSRGRRLPPQMPARVAGMYLGERP